MLDHENSRLRRYRRSLTLLLLQVLGYLFCGLFLLALLEFFCTLVPEFFLEPRESRKVAKTSCEASSLGFQLYSLIQLKGRIPEVIPVEGIRPQPDVID